MSRYQPVREVHRAAVFFALATFAASSEDAPSLNGDATSTGRFTLRTVNGARLPASLGTTDGVVVEVLSGEVTINADGSFSDITRYRCTDGDTVLTDRIEVEGTYERAGDTLTFTVIPCGQTTSMSIRDDTLTQIENGTFVYRV